MTHLIGDIAFVGDVNSVPVALPRELSQPIIYPVKLLEKDVCIPTNPPSYIRSNCLILPQSAINAATNAAALAATTTNLQVGTEYSSFIYELEMFPCKESLYGHLFRGWVLSKNSRGVLFRTQNQFQIIVKKYNKEAADRRQFVDNPLQEFSILQYLGDYHQHVSGQIICLADTEYYYSVMKFRGYDLGSYVFTPTDAPPLSEQCVRHLFRQLLRGMEYLQSLGICHRDLSVENLIYDEETHCLSIIDFGMSLILPMYPSNERPYLIPNSGSVGKQHYMPPEIIANNRSFDGFRSDSWNLGILLFIFLTKKYIVKFANPLCPYYKHIAAGGLKRLLEFWNLGLSSDAIDLLCHLIQPDPLQRYTLNEIQNHPWVRDGNETPIGRAVEVVSSTTFSSSVVGGGAVCEGQESRVTAEEEKVEENDHEPVASSS